MNVKYSSRHRDDRYRHHRAYSPSLDSPQSPPIDRIYHYCSKCKRTWDQAAKPKCTCVPRGQKSSASWSMKFISSIPAFDIPQKARPASNSPPLKYDEPMMTPVEPSELPRASSIYPYQMPPPPPPPPPQNPHHHDLTWAIASPQYFQPPIIQSPIPVRPHPQTPFPLHDPMHDLYLRTYPVSPPPQLYHDGTLIPTHTLYPDPTRIPEQYPYPYPSVPYSPFYGPPHGHFLDPRGPRSRFLNN